MARVLTRLRGTSRTFITGFATAAVLVEIFYPPVALRSYGSDQTSALRSLTPPANVLAAYDALADRSGAILDLPYGESVPWREQADYVFYSAYHARPVAACYNSFLSPSYASIRNMVPHLDSEMGIRELAAAGLEDVVVHATEKQPIADAMARSPLVETLLRNESASAFHITAHESVVSDPSILRFEGVRVPAALDRLRFLPALLLTVRNPSEQMFALAHPIAPIEARLRFVSAGEPLPLAGDQHSAAVGARPGPNCRRADSYDAAAGPRELSSRRRHTGAAPQNGAGRRRDRAMNEKLIIIPCRNESAAIGRVVRRYLGSAPVSTFS